MRLMREELGAVVASLHAMGGGAAERKAALARKRSKQNAVAGVAGITPHPPSSVIPGAATLGATAERTGATAEKLGAAAAATPGAAAAESSGAKVTPPTVHGASSAGDLPPGWQEAMSPSGKPYYYHRESGVTRWSRPESAAPDAAAATACATSEDRLQDGEHVASKQAPGREWEHSRSLAAMPRKGSLAGMESSIAARSSLDSSPTADTNPDDSPQATLEA